MKLFVRGLFTSGLLLAALMLTGCASSFDEPFLLSNQSVSPVPGSPETVAEREAADVAHFHVGETIKIVFSGTVDQIPEHDEPIKEDGTITLPLIGSIQASGKTAGELQTEIHDLYVPKYYVRLNVTVTPGDLVYYVSGEVKQPGRQLYLGETTVTKAITSAGDFTDFANHSKVWLIRSNGQRIKVNVDEALRDPTKDPRVYPGDQIQVPRRLF